MTTKDSFGKLVAYVLVNVEGSRVSSAKQIDLSEDQQQVETM